MFVASNHGEIAGPTDQLQGDEALFENVHVTDGFFDIVENHLCTDGRCF